MSCITDVCREQTQTCISLFQQTTNQLRHSQATVITGVLMGAGLIRLGVNDFAELIQLGGKALSGRQINRKKTDLLFLASNGCLKLTCGTLFVVSRFHARTYQWNSSTPYDCLTLANLTEATSSRSCNEICLSIMHIPSIRMTFNLPVIVGSINLVVSVIAAVFSTVIIYNKAKQKKNDEEVLLVSDPYKEKKFKPHILTHILQMSLSFLILVLFCTNVAGFQNNIFDQPQSYPSIANKCGEFCK